MKREELIYEGKRSLACIAGAAVYAVGINLFVVPAGLYAGGIMGISQVIRTLLTEYLHLNFGTLDIAGLIYYVINIPIFILAFTRLGKNFFVKTLITVTAMSALLSAIPPTKIVEDSMAACVVGGILAGAGLGMVLRLGSSGGGMDVIGVMLAKWKRDFSVGKVNLLMNLVLYGTCLFLFDEAVVVYSIIYAAASSLAMDRMHTQNINVEVNVITKVNTAELEKEVFDELGRGITKWAALGAYTNDQTHILYITLSKYEVNHLKNIIRKYDENAFIVVNEGVTVVGHYMRKL